MYYPVVDTKSDATGGEPREPLLLCSFSRCSSQYITYAGFSVMSVHAGSDGHIDVDMEQQADNFLAFFIGGREPMVTVIAFALLLTLKHPEVLARYTVILS